MITGAVAYWLKGWAISVTVLALFLVKVLPLPEKELPYHMAFGMDYSTQAIYHLDSLRKNTSEKEIEADKAQTLQILENWRKKFPPSVKPKMIVTAVSGGGIRSAMWTLRTMQLVDSLTQQRLTNHTTFLTGSSGGMIGAAYYRELYLRGLENTVDSTSLYKLHHVQQLGKDKLNSVIFALVAADMLFRFQTFELDGRTYYKDRGFTLDRQLLQDLDSVLDKPIIAYRQPEMEAKIPMLLIAPNVVNDGRKLYISAQDVSYMNAWRPYSQAHKEDVTRGIEFRQFFAQQNADSLKFFTALRMNATFPYITPNIVLPSDPAVAILDAGVSDNFGISDALQLIHVFKDWIAENTSGVILLTIRDKPKERALSGSKKFSSISHLMAPINALAGNLFELQDMNNDRLLQHASTWLDVPFHRINFQYVTSTVRNREQEASLSWRLTTKEKQSILDSAYSDYNRQALHRLDSLLMQGRATE